MKTLILLVAAVIVTTEVSISQENDFDWNVVISIDEKVVTQGLYKAYLINKKEEPYDSIRIKYIPGSITLYENISIPSDFEEFYLVFSLSSSQF